MRRSFRGVCASLASGHTTPASEAARCVAACRGEVNAALNAVVAVRGSDGIAQCVERATKVVAARAAAKSDGADVSMAGVPVLVKDCIHVAGMATGDGVGAGQDEQPTDAAVVQRLKAAGAVVVGKTNLPAHSMEVQTFNDTFGVTGSPYDVSLTAGGSSGGSAAAVAAGICDVALGTDLAGSLRIPAAFCGISSLRPSLGRVPYEGALPPMDVDEQLAPSAARLGALGRDVDALRAFLDAMDTAPSHIPSRPFDTLPIAVTPALDGMPTAAAVRDAVQAFSERLRGVDVDVNSDVQPFQGSLLRDVGRAHATMTSAWLPRMKPPPEDALQAAFETRDEAQAAVDAVLESHRAWVLPATASLPFPHTVDGAPVDIDGTAVPYWRAMISNVIPLTVTGHPVVTLPIFTRSGDLPVGVQVVGRQGCDEELLDICQQLFDIAHEHWFAPKVFVQADGGR